MTEQDEGPAWVEFADEAGAACLVAAVAWQDGQVRTALPAAALGGRSIEGFAGELVLAGGERLAVRALVRADGWVWLEAAAELEAAARAGCGGGRVELVWRGKGT